MATRQHYLSKEDLILWLTDPVAHSEELGAGILNLCVQVAKRYTRSQGADLEDRIATGVLECWRAISRGQVMPDGNPFSYLTQVAINGIRHDDVRKFDRQVTSGLPESGVGRRTSDLTRPRDKSPNPKLDGLPVATECETPHSIANRIKGVTAQSVMGMLEQLPLFDVAHRNRQAWSIETGMEVEKLIRKSRQCLKPHH